MKGKGGRRRKQLLDELKEMKGYCKLKEEALDRTLWRTGLWKRLRTCCKTNCAMNGCVPLPICVTTSLKSVYTNTLAVTKIKCRVPGN